MLQRRLDGALDSARGIALLPYDRPEYAQALRHVGQPWSGPQLQVGLVERAIPGSTHVDAFAPWPYVNPWSPAVATALLARLRERGHVTLTAVFRPDAFLDACRLRGLGIECAPLKEHFVFDRGASLPPFGCKARSNLARALRHWHVERVALADAWPRVATLHDCIAARRPSMSAIARPPGEHFRVLAEIPGMSALGAYDEEGLGGALVIAENSIEIHCHLLAGGERYYRFGAAYALFHYAVTVLGRERTVYLGGAPAGPDGPGIAHFKRRFATRTAPVWLATAVLDAAACAELSAGRDAGGFFPPYRR